MFCDCRALRKKTKKKIEWAKAIMQMLGIWKLCHQEEN